MAFLGLGHCAAHLVPGGARSRDETVSVTHPNGHEALAPTPPDVVAGGFTVPFGPSGAGKSTLLRRFNGLVRPGTGRVLNAGGADIACRAVLRAHRRATGMVFQQHPLIDRVSVLGNVLTGRLG